MDIKLSVSKKQFVLEVTKSCWGVLAKAPLHLKLEIMAEHG
jgi:hypothetical protein